MWGIIAHQVYLVIFFHHAHEKFCQEIGVKIAIFSIKKKLQNLNFVVNSSKFNRCCRATFFKN